MTFATCLSRSMHFRKPTMCEKEMRWKKWNDKLPPNWNSIKLCTLINSHSDANSNGFMQKTTVQHFGAEKLTHFCFLLHMNVFKANGISEMKLILNGKSHAFRVGALKAHTFQLFTLFLFEQKPFGLNEMALIIRSHAFTLFMVSFGAAPNIPNESHYICYCGNNVSFVVWLLHLVKQ